MELKELLKTKNSFKEFTMKNSSNIKLVLEKSEKYFNWLNDSIAIEKDETIKTKLIVEWLKHIDSSIRLCDKNGVKHIEISSNWNTKLVGLVLNAVKAYREESAMLQEKDSESQPKAYTNIEIAMGRLIRETDFATTLYCFKILSEKNPITGLPIYDIKESIKQLENPIDFKETETKEDEEFLSQNTIQVDDQTLEVMLKQFASIDSPKGLKDKMIDIVNYLGERTEANANNYATAMKVYYNRIKERGFLPDYGGYFNVFKEKEVTTETVSTEELGDIVEIMDYNDIMNS